MHQSAPRGIVVDLAQTLFVQSDMVIELQDHVQCVFGHIGLWGEPVLVGGRCSDPGVTYCRISRGVIQVSKNANDTRGYYQPVTIYIVIRPAFG